MLDAFKAQSKSFLQKGLIQTYENFSSLGQRQIDEFVELMKEKMEAEYARAEALDKLS